MPSLHSRLIHMLIDIIIILTSGRVKRHTIAREHTGERTQESQEEEEEFEGAACRNIANRSVEMRSYN